jgi:hypothetical protein
MKHKPALYALERLHAELGGKIKDNKREAARLVLDMKHVEAVLRLLEPGFNVSAIAARRKYKSTAPFKRGHSFRLIMDILRKATEPVTTRQIVETILRDHGGDQSMKAIRNLVPTVQSALKRHQGTSVEAVGEGMPVRWVILKDAT